jgi:hypothetical protein
MYMLFVLQVKKSGKRTEKKEKPRTKKPSESVLLFFIGEAGEKHQHQPREAEKV